jgi:REP element-mobilizing transposase RayT
MARDLRLEYPGAIYHIINRGNRREEIFLGKEDFHLFLELFEDISKRMNWVCHAYCLMTNHYHLLIEIPDGVLSRGMAWLNSVYAQKFNRKYGLTGHLFQGRFKSKPVEDNMQFLMTARYVVRNPVDANVVENAEQWPWSSYRATVGNIQPPDYLFTDDVLSNLSNDRRTAQVYYRELIRMELKDNDDEIITLFQKVYAGEREPVFSKRIRTVLDMKDSLGPVPRKQRILSRPKLEELFVGGWFDDPQKRNGMIYEAFKLYGYKQSEIASFLNLTQTTISKIISNT